VMSQAEINTQVGKVIVPAPGATKIVVPLIWSAFADFKAGRNTTSDLQCFYQGDTNRVMQDISAIITNTADKLVRWSLPWASYVAPWNGTSADPRNKAIIAKANVATSGGNAADQLIIEMAYMVITGV
jgi:hypothetical protein